MRPIPRTNPVHRFPGRRHPRGEHGVGRRSGEDAWRLCPGARQRAQSLQPLAHAHKDDLLRWRAGLRPHPRPRLLSTANRRIGRAAPCAGRTAPLEVLRRGASPDRRAFMNSPGNHRLRARRLGIDTHSETVVFMRKDSPVCRSEGFTSHNRIALSLLATDM